MSEYKILRHSNLLTFNTKTGRWEPSQKIFIVSKPDGTRWEVPIPVELEERDGYDSESRIERALNELVKNGRPL
jgi:hypothetical protein